MADSSSQNPTSPEITPKEEPVTLDKPQSPNPFLPAIQVEFTFEEITFTTNNKVTLLYPSHPNQEYFKDVSDFISKCCLKEAFTRSLNQYKEYLIYNLAAPNVPKASKPSSIVKRVPQGIKPGAQHGHKKQSTSSKQPSVSSREATKGHDALANSTAEANPGTSAPRSNLSILKDKIKSAGDRLKIAHTTSDELIIVLDESEKDEEVAKDKDTKDTSEELKQAKAEVAPMKAKPSYPDINQLTKLLVTSLKPELSKLLASHDFASCLPTKLKELPSKITELSGEIKELKQHVRDMEIKLPGDLVEIPTKLETFTFTISTLSSQKKLQTLDLLPSLLRKVTDTLNRFSTMVDNASGATSMNVPSAGQVTASPAEGEKNTKDAGTNLKYELINLLGKDVVTQYYTKKLHFDKYNEFEGDNTLIVIQPPCYSASKAIYADTVFEFWASCKKSNKSSLTETVLNAFKSILFSADEVRKCLRLCKGTAKPLSHEKAKTKLLSRIRYGGKLNKKVKRKFMVGIWNYLFAHISECLGMKSGGFDQPNALEIQIAHALFTGRDIDYASLLTHMIVEASAEEKSKYVPYVRILGLLIQQGLNDDFNEGDDDDHNDDENENNDDENDDADDENKGDDHNDNEDENDDDDDDQVNPSSYDTLKIIIQPSTRVTDPLADDILAKSLRQECVFKLDATIESLERKLCAFEKDPFTIATKEKPQVDPLTNAVP
nr:hypothetical protein [Tanacetum cinerariifolium]